MEHSAANSPFSIVLLPVDLFLAGRRLSKVQLAAALRGWRLRLRRKSLVRAKRLPTRNARYQLFTRRSGANVVAILNLAGRQNPNAVVLPDKSKQPVICDLIWIDHPSLLESSSDNCLLT